MKGSRKASNKAGRGVSWEQGRRRGHGQEGIGAGPPAQSNRMKTSTPMSVCRSMARNVPRSSSRGAGTTVCANGLSRLINDTAAVLAAHSEAQSLRRSHHLLSGDPWQFAHTANNSASSLSSGTGRPSSRKTAM